MLQHNLESTITDGCLEGRQYQGCEFERPEESVINDFKEILTQKHYTVIIRHSKGQDISAACGQLIAKLIV